MNTKPKKTLTVAGAARRLGVMPRHVYDLVYAGRLAAAKVRGRWRISTAAVENRRKQRRTALDAAFEDPFEEAGKTAKPLSGVAEGL